MADGGGGKAMHTRFLARGVRQRLDATALAAGRDINGLVLVCMLYGGLSLSAAGKDGRTVGTK